MLLREVVIEVRIELILAKRRERRDRRQTCRRRGRRDGELTVRQLRVEQRDDERIDVDRRHAEGCGETGRRAVAVSQTDGDHRKRQAVVERCAVALARALIRTEEEEAIFHERAAERAAKLIAREHRLGPARRFQKEVVRIQRAVAEKLIDVAVIVLPAGARHSFDVAARVAPLRSVVERSLHDELLQAVGRGHGDIGRRVCAD